LAPTGVAGANAGPGYHCVGAPTSYFAGDDLADARDRLTREDLEAMRQEFDAGSWHRYGRPFGLDDDLYQVRRIEWAGYTLSSWAKARGCRWPTPRRYAAFSDSIEQARLRAGVLL
jgi:hypothetical protein